MKIKTAILFMIVCLLSSIGYIFAQEESMDIDKMIARYEKEIKWGNRTIENYIELGNLYHDKKDFDKAILNYKQALKLDENRADIMTSIGIFYYRDKRDFEKGAEYLEYAISIDSQNVIALYHLGKIYLYAGNPHEALKYFEKVYKLKSDNPAINYFYASALHQMEDKERYPEAIELYKRALEYGWEDKDIVYCNLSGVYEELGDIDNAIKYDKMAIEYSQWPPSYVGLSGIYNQQGRHKEAMKLAKKAIELAPKYPEAYFQLALVYKVIGDKEKAVVYCEKTEKLLNLENEIDRQSFLNVRKIKNELLGIKESIDYPYLDAKGYQTIQEQSKQVPSNK